MSNYTIVIQADTDQAKRDIKDVETVADTAAAKKRSFNFEFPDVSQVSQAFAGVSQSIGAATKDVGNLYQALKLIPEVGDGLTGIEEIFKGIRDRVSDTILVISQFTSAGKSLETIFGIGAISADNLINSLARVGLAIDGIKGIVDDVIKPLKKAFGSLFDETIGQAAKFNESILTTVTSFASMNKVFNKGKEITEPLDKIQALTGTIGKNIDSIRLRSLELAGVTSKDVLGVFQVVAAQIGAVNGNLKQAEDLAISFTAALGTMGIPLWQAQQEIRSIMQGTITHDSFLAHELGITDKDIKDAKTKAGGVVDYLKDKLDTAVKGQAILSHELSGVMSNFKEVQQLIGQLFGQQLIGPLIDALTVVYNKLIAISNSLYAIAAVAGNVINTVARIAAGSLSEMSQTIPGSPKKNATSPENENTQAIPKGPITQLYEQMIRPPVTQVNEDLLRKLKTPKDAEDKLRTAVDEANKNELKSDSYLAKRLGITDKDIKDAENKTNGIITLVNRKLEERTTSRDVLGIKQIMADVETGLLKVFNMFRDVALQAVDNIRRAFLYLQPAITQIFEAVQTLVHAFLQIKAAEFEGFVQMIDNVADMMSGLVGTLASALNFVSKIFNMPIVAELAKIKVELDIFRKFGGEIVFDFAKFFTFAYTTGLPVFSLMANAIKFVGSAISGLFNIISKGIAELMTSIARLITSGERIISYFESLGTETAQVITELKAVAESVTDLGKAFILFGTNMIEIAIAIKEAFIVSLKTIQEVLSVLAAQFPEIGAAFRLVGEVFTQVLTTFKEAFAGLKGSFTGLESTFEALGNTINAVAKGIAEAMGSLRTLFQNLAEFVKIMIGAVVAQFKALGASFGAVFVSLNELRVKVFTLVQQIWEPIYKLFKSIIDGFKQLYNEVKPQIEKLEALLQQLGQAAENTANKFMSMATNTKGAVGLIGGAIRMLVESALPMLAFQATIGLFLEGVNRINQHFDELNEKVRTDNALKEVAKWAGVAADKMSLLQKNMLEFNKALLSMQAQRLTQEIADLQDSMDKVKRDIDPKTRGQVHIESINPLDPINLLYGKSIFENLFQKNDKIPEQVFKELETQLKDKEARLNKILVTLNKPNAGDNITTRGNDENPELKSKTDQQAKEDKEQAYSKTTLELMLERARAQGKISEEKAKEIEQDIKLIENQVKLKQLSDQLVIVKKTKGNDDDAVRDLKKSIEETETKGIKLKVEIDMQKFKDALALTQKINEYNQLITKSSIGEAVHGKDLAPDIASHLQTVKAIFENEGNITHEMASQLEKMNEMLSIEGKIKNAQVELKKIKQYNPINSIAVVEALKQIQELKNQRINIIASINKEQFDLGIKQMQRDAAAVERSLQMQSSLISHNLNITQAQGAAEKARLTYASTELDIEEKLAAANNKGVVDDTTRLDIADKRRQIAIAQAEIEYQMAIAQIQAQVQLSQIEAKRAALKVSEVQAELQLAAARKQDTTAYTEAVKAAQNSADLANQIVDSTQQIAQYQAQAAAYSRDTAVASANAAYQQEQIAVATERAQRNSQQFASNMQSAAQSASSVNSSMQSAGSAMSGGGGGGGGSVSGNRYTGKFGEQLDMNSIPQGAVATGRGDYFVDGKPVSQAEYQAALSKQNTPTQVNGVANAIGLYSNTGSIQDATSQKNATQAIQNALKSALQLGIKPSQLGLPEYDPAYGRVMQEPQKANAAMINAVSAYANYLYDQYQFQPQRNLVTQAQALGHTFAQFSASAMQAAQQSLAGLGVRAFATGGIVDQPTLGLLGEAGEREFVIPESKMAGAARSYLRTYSRDGISDTPPEGVHPINITTGPVVQFDGTQYVTMDDFQRGLRQTAEGVIGRLRTPSARIALGIR